MQRLPFKQGRFEFCYFQIDYKRKPQATKSRNNNLKLITNLRQSLRNDSSYLYAAIITLIALVLIVGAENGAVRQDMGETLQNEDKASQVPADNQPILIGNYSEQEIEAILRRETEFWVMFEKSNPEQRAKLLARLIQKVVNRNNTRVKYDQAHLQKLSDSAEDSSHHAGSNLKKLKRLEKKYQVTQGSLEQKKAEMTRRVDIVPASLVSAIGLIQLQELDLQTLRRTNNLFAKRCNKQACEWLDNGNAQSSRAIRYIKLEDSIKEFFDSVNRSSQFSQLRQQRLIIKQRNQRLTARILADEFGRLRGFVDSPNKRIIAALKQYNLE
jgi:uncharacterized FlgJ-related protein